MTFSRVQKGQLRRRQPPFSLVEGGRQPCYNRLMIEYYQKVADLWPRYGEIDSTIVHQASLCSSLFSFVYKPILYH